MIATIIAALVLLGGFLAQYIDGTLGMGYGVTNASLLMGAGLTPALVSASVHTAEIFASIASGISHWWFRNIDKKIVLRLLPTGIVGGVFGAYFLVLMPGKFMKPFVGIILLLLGGRIFVRYALKKHIVLGKGEFTKKFLMPLGFLGGTIDAIGGGGWGPVCTSTMASTAKTEPRYVIGSVNLSEVLVTIAIVLTFGLTIGFENFLWHITIPLIIGGVIAAPMAAYTCKKIPAVALGSAVGIILVTINARTIVKYLPRVLRLGTIIKPELIFIPLAIILLCIAVFSRKEIRAKIRKLVKTRK